MGGSGTGRPAAAEAPLRRPTLDHRQAAVSGGSFGAASPTYQFQAIVPAAALRQTTASLRSYMPGIRSRAGVGRSVKCM